MDRKRLIGASVHPLSHKIEWVALTFARITLDGLQMSALLVI